MTYKPKKNDQSPYVFQNKKIGLGVSLETKIPWTPKQLELFRLIQDKNTKIVFLSGPAGTSKAQPLDSILITPSGCKQMGEIRPGDKVFNIEGTPATVVSVHPQGVKKIFKVCFSDGAYTECCGDHLWETQTNHDRNYRIKRSGKRFKSPLPGSVKTTQEIKNSLFARGGSHLNHSIPIVRPVQFDKRKLNIDPYVLGILLGDGCIKYEVTFASADPFIINELLVRIPDCEIVAASGYNYRIAFRNTNKNLLKDHLRNYELFGKGALDKFIPQDYLFSAVEDRVALLRGLMDSDGSTSRQRNSSCESFSTISPQLRDDFIFLVQSLGGTCTYSTQFPYYYNKDGVKIFGQEAYLIQVCMNPEINPFLLPRKANIYIPKTKYKPRRYITSVEPCGEKECQCILIDDPRHLYLTNDFIATHNTVTAVYAGLTALQEKKVSDIVYVRSVVESATQKMGFLPGSANDKLSVYLEPLLEKLEEIVGPENSKNLISKNLVSARPINFLRGCQFSGKFVIADEAQNFSYGDLVTFLTRVGEFSKIIVCGDPMQSDIGDKSAFKSFFNLFSGEDSKENGIVTFEFDEDDIVRSKILKFIVKKIQEI